MNPYAQTLEAFANHAALAFAYAVLALSLGGMAWEIGGQLRRAWRDTDPRR